MRPAFDTGPGLEQCREPMLVQTFIAQPPVEGLNVGILVRLARLDQAQGNSLLVSPCHHRFTAKLPAVVRPDHLRQTALNGQSVQQSGNALPGNGPFQLDGHGLVGASSTIVRHLIARPSAVRSNTKSIDHA